MTDTNHAWLWIGYVTTADGDPAAAFVVDERDCPDADTTVMAAADELRRRGLAHEFEHVRVRPDVPARPLPSWTQYRQSLVDGDV